MDSEMILCIPGPWNDRSQFLAEVITSKPEGRFMFAGLILADVQQKDHITLDFAEAEPQMAKAFEIAGQGTLSTSTLEQIAQHKSVAYLHLSIDAPSQKARLLKFTQLLQNIGGLAVKVESAGVAHDWKRWFERLNGTPFDLYCAFVVLIADETHYYSCGMHHFGLPDCEVSRAFSPSNAAELMNRFNYWQITEQPRIQSGHTFSLTTNTPAFKLYLRDDTRHYDGDLFHNPHGIWRLHSEVT